MRTSSANKKARPPFEGRANGASKSPVPFGLSFQSAPMGGHICAGLLRCDLKGLLQWGHPREREPSLRTRMRKSSGFLPVPQQTGGHHVVGVVAGRDFRVAVSALAAGDCQALGFHGVGKPELAQLVRRFADRGAQPPELEVEAVEHRFRALSRIAREDVLEILTGIAQHFPHPPLEFRAPAMAVLGVEVAFRPDVHSQ